MGVDVCGRNPVSKSGESFQSNWQGWRPILSLIRQLCDDLLDVDTHKAIERNDGAGPNDQAVCTEMANRFARWMEHNVDGYSVEIPNVQVAKEPTVIAGVVCHRHVSNEELIANPEIETISPYRIDDNGLKEWVEFLRSCGGFEVW